MNILTETGLGSTLIILIGLIAIIMAVRKPSDK